MKFQLEIQKVEHTCIFKLIWGKGQQISTNLIYPETLSQLYQTWRNAYLNFYQTALRARIRKPKNEQGKFSLPQDWHRQLVQAEAHLLSEFHRWLRQEELYEIRSKIATEANSTRTPTSLFLTCSQELERLPWEAWELGTEFGGTVMIARNPKNITNTTKKIAKRSRKPRILAILGDDTGLDFKGDRDSLNTLKQVAEIKLVTWQPNQPASVIKQQIQKALIHAKGWEVLFFAGHSNETAITGGELAIAPNITISVSEIAPQLKIAQSKGLQFALFNSCSGLGIANSLIDLGLSQVAVMREPIHNQVAQVFLIQFLHALANYQNVQQALISAEKHLKQEQNLTYPSAYLIPSLFCHPDAQLFCIEPWGWKQQLKKILPNRTEAMIAATLCLLSILPSVQSFLLDKRTLVQSIHRDITRQFPEDSVPVTLIHIDEESLRKAGIAHPKPMNRVYLASLIDRLVAADAQIIGIDYLLDRTHPNHDPKLAKSIKSAVEQHQTWFVFGAYKQNDRQELGITTETGIGSPNWTLQGYTDGLPEYMSLLPESENCSRVCPFAFLLTMIQMITHKSENSTLQPNVSSKSNLRDSVYEYIDNNNQEYKFINQTRLLTFTSLVQFFGQQWLRPIQDFSLPPDLVYNRLPAWKLFDNNNANFSQQIIIIGSGGYTEAGLTEGSDNFSMPSAIAYWHIFGGSNRFRTSFTGSEFLAYMTHHFKNRRLVVPIPEIVTLLTALLIAKSIKLSLTTETFATKRLLIFLASATTIYGLIALQIYISQALVLPWLLPSIAIWTYLLPITKGKSHE